MNYETKRALADFIVALEDQKLEGEVEELYDRAFELLSKEKNWVKLVDFARDYRDRPLDYISHFC